MEESVALGSIRDRLNLVCRPAAVRRQGCEKVRRQGCEKVRRQGCEKVRPSGSEERRLRRLKSGAPKSGAPKSSAPNSD
jgi:hypothetical protein